MDIASAGRSRRAPADRLVGGTGRLLSIAVATVLMVMACSNGSADRPVAEFAPVAGLCGKVDVTVTAPVVAGLLLEVDKGSPIPEPGQTGRWQQLCVYHPATERGAARLIVHAAISDTPEMARGAHESILRTGDRPQALADGWDQGSVHSKEEPSGIRVQFDGVDDVLLVVVELSVSPIMADEKGQRAVVAKIAADVREVLRRK
ncbi:hypothetical protein [Nonomuraea sp. SYSU D8015]|uniref:hypothetical protein n=1 Tax=Nonomuraea sp. SYSU D8015 TaxID=2593644 RepID=UPI0016609953|nr:hypothetical protein [Nonomuraea sp. SYSU D8015]